ncbi:putative growth arrest-specific protein 2 isoform X1, partial [Apostichopus japonicus]
MLGVRITNDNFIDSLSNGVLLCKLAQLIQGKVAERCGAGKNNNNLPTKKIRFHERAPAESFIARDNVATFLSWCREFGLADTCLFETDDLVLQKGPKNVLVCVYELARMGCKYDIEPPALLKLEKEIEREEKNPRPPSGKSKKTIGKLDKE